MSYAGEKSIYTAQSRTGGGHLVSRVQTSLCAKKWKNKKTKKRRGEDSYLAQTAAHLTNKTDCEWDVEHVCQLWKASVWFIEWNLSLYSTELWDEHKDPPQGREQKGRCNFLLWYFRLTLCQPKNTRALLQTAQRRHVFRQLARPNRGWFAEN